MARKSKEETFIETAFENLAKAGLVSQGEDPVTAIKQLCLEGVLNTTHFLWVQGIGRKGLCPLLESLGIQEGFVILDPDRHVAKTDVLRPWLDEHE